MHLETILKLNLIDYIIVSILFGSMIISLIRGFFKELISIIIWIVGFWIAIKFYNQFSIMLVPYIKNLSLRLIVSFGGLFILVLILGAISSHLLSFIIIKSGFSGFDRLLGLIFGCIRGILLVSIILLLISTTSFIQDNWWKDSIIIPHLQIIVEWLRTFLPEKLTTLTTIIHS